MTSSNLDPRLMAGLLSAAQSLTALIVTLAGAPGTPGVEPVTPDPEPRKPGMPAQLAKSWKSYPGKGVAVKKNSAGQWVDCRSALAKAPAKAKRVKSPPAPVQQSRVAAVAERETAQIAEARRIESLYRSGVLSQQQAIDLAYHEIGQKRARAMMS